MPVLFSCNEENDLVAKAVDPQVVGNDKIKTAFNIGLKGVYDVNPLKVGFGYLTDAARTAVDTDGVTAMGVFGSYKLMEDALTVGGEYQSRTYPTAVVADP